VNGTGFVSRSLVEWNGSVRTTNYISNSKLMASILATDISSLNTASVTVVNPAPGGGTSNVAFFEVTQPTSWAALLAPATVSAGDDLIPVAVGDFNEDGKLDLAVADSSSNNVSLLLGNGDGTFQSAVVYSVGQSPSSVAVGDFNGDGRLDLAVANSGSNNVSILLGNGDGTFQSAVESGAGESPGSVAVGDFNGDGKLDLALAGSNNGNGYVSILLGNGDGTFQPAVVYGVGLNPGSVAVGDFNGDGTLDLALIVANDGVGYVNILLGNGDGTFQTAVEYGAGAGQVPTSVAVGDFNGDGRLDLAVAAVAVVGLGGSANVSILLGNGDGTFQPAMVYSDGGIYPGPVVLADFNGDDRLDLAVANTGDINVSILLGNGDGTFQPALEYGAGLNPDSLAVGDFNGDGRLDLVTANGSVSVLLQRGVVSGPNATLSATELRFECRNEPNAGCQCITSGSAMLSNFGTETLSISSDTITGPFSGGRCGATLEPGQYCTFGVTWSETSGDGVLSFFDNAPGSPQTVTLDGEKSCTPPAAAISKTNLAGKPAGCVQR
jgi:hypothetical protein